MFFLESFCPGTFSEKLHESLAETKRTSKLKAALKEIHPRGLCNVIINNHFTVSSCLCAVWTFCRSYNVWNVCELHFPWYQVFKQCKASGPLRSRSCSVCCTLKCWTISCRQQWVLDLGFKSYSCVLRWTFVVFIFQIVMLKLQLLEQRKPQSLNW